MNKHNTKSGKKAITHIAENNRTVVFNNTATGYYCTKTICHFEGNSSKHNSDYCVNTTHQNTHITSYIFAKAVVLLLTILLITACGGKDEPPAPPPIGKNTPPAFKNLPDTIRLDIKNKPTIADFKKELKTYISDDNTAKSKLTISVSPMLDFTKTGSTNITITATDDGTDSNGETKTKKSANAKTVVKISDTTPSIAQFPNTLAGLNDDGKLTVGENDFFKNIFNQEITITRGEETTKTKPFKITKNGTEVNKDNTINQVGTYEIEIFVKNSKGEILSKKYTLVVEYKDIETEDLSSYTEIQGSELIANGINHRETLNNMGIPGLQKILEHNIIAPSDKTTTVLEIGEGDHVFGKHMKKIIGNTNSIQYKLLSLQDYGGNANNEQFRNDIKKEIENYTKNGDFLLTEINQSARGESDYPASTNFGNTFKDNNLVFAAFFEGLEAEYEKLAQQGYGKVSLPGFKAENGKRYLYLNVSRSDPESNPFINSIEEPLYVGIDFGSSSGASAANAATWALGVNLLHRLDYTVNRSFWNSIFTDSQYNECFEDAYWMDTDGKLGVKDKEYKKGRVLIWDKFINKFKVFALNLEAIKSLQKGQKVPLMKYWDKINHSYLHIAEKKGIVSEEKNGKTIFYLDYNLLANQIGEDNVPQFLANPHYEYLIGDDTTNTYYWKPIN